MSGHKHWCEDCHGWWRHEDEDCYALAYDGTFVPDLPCPEHADKPLTRD